MLHSSKAAEETALTSSLSCCDEANILGIEDRGRVRSEKHETELVLHST